jgi:hypothetical protein
MPSLRALLLGLVLLGAAGLLVELALLEHYGSFWQVVPLFVLGFGLGAAVLVAARPGPGTLRAFRLVMGALVITGALGVFLHYDENVAFELELGPDLRGIDLIWAALRGATPILAPGAFLQLGLLGLILVHDHPALQRAAADEESER